MGDESNKPSWHKDLSDYEVQRLQFFVLSGRINSTLIQVFDTFTDLLFVATLYVFSQPGDTSDSILGVLAATDGTLNLGTEERDYDLFNSLFIAALFFFLVNGFLRLGLAGMRARLYWDKFDGVMDWAKWFFGALVCVVEPHNGILFIDSIFKDHAYIRSDYASTQEEIKLDIFLLGLEDLPQFILQIVFAVSVTRNQLTVSWYISTIITILKLSSAFAGIGIMALRLSKLKKKTKDSAAVSTAY